MRRRPWTGTVQWHTPNKPISCHVKSCFIKLTITPYESQIYWSRNHSKVIHVNLPLKNSAPSWCEFSSDFLALFLDGEDMLMFSYTVSNRKYWTAVMTCDLILVCKQKFRAKVAKLLTNRATRYSNFCSFGTLSPSFRATNLAAKSINLLLESISGPVPVAICDFWFFTLITIKSLYFSNRPTLLFGKAYYQWRILGGA